MSKSAKHLPENWDQILGKRGSERDGLLFLLAEALFGPKTSEQRTEDEALEEAEAVGQARKGNTLPLIDYLVDQPPGPLRDYILDILLHNVRKVPKPRRRAVQARQTYFQIAVFAGICERVGMSPTEAVRKTQDHFQFDDDKTVWRARKRHPAYRTPKYIDLYIELDRLFEEVHRGDINGELNKLIHDAVERDPNLLDLISPQSSARIAELVFHATRRHPELVDLIYPQSPARTASEPLTGSDTG